jgi:tetrahydromethanopterin S-methyltransferase subunit G
MQTMRDRWTDERLDDLNEKVDRGFALMERRFERVDERFDRIDERFERVDERFEALHRLMLQLGGVVIAALIGLIATQL